MDKRAVLYARVSYDDRDTDGRNLAGQLDMGREYCAGRGHRVVAELAEDDRGASGADWDLPQLTRALEMARAGEFDVLVVRELDRFARGLAKQLVIESEFKRAGVEVEYVLGEYADTPEGSLMKNVRAVISEYERLKITERMVRGKRLKVEAGNVIIAQRPPYGYRAVEKDGKATLEVYEPEAQVIRLIFTWYTEGDGERGPIGIWTIAKRLTEMCIFTAADTGVRKGGSKKKGPGEWGRSIVYLMLKNTTYAGTWRYGKRNNRQGKVNPDSHTLGVEVPAIISHEVWEAAQARLSFNRRSARREPKYEYLLRGHLTCGVCGLKMSGFSTFGGSKKGYLYYQCPALYGYSYGHKCNAPRFRADQVDAAVWAWLKEKLADPDRLALGLAEYQSEQDKANEPIRARLAVVESLVADNQKQLEKLLDLYLAGDFPKEMLTERKTRLETTIDALGKERAGLAASLEAATLTGEQIQTIQEFAARIKGSLESAAFATRRGMIELLNVTVTLAVEDGVKVVYPQCVLPGGQDTLSIEHHHEGECASNGIPARPKTQGKPCEGSQPSQGLRVYPT